MLKMDQVHVLRHKVLKEGQSIRRVARELGLSRNTVAKYLGQLEPLRSSRQPRERPVWEAVQPRLEELVAEWAPRTTAQQRITAMRLHRQLKAEGYRVGRTLVGDYWRERRRQRAEVYVPLVNRPGEAQIELFEPDFARIGAGHDKGGVESRGKAIRLAHLTRSHAATVARRSRVSYSLTSTRRLRPASCGRKNARNCCRFLPPALKCASPSRSRSARARWSGSKGPGTQCHRAGRV